VLVSVAKSASLATDVFSVDQTAAAALDDLQTQVERLDPKGWAEIAAKQSAWEADPEHGRKRTGRPPKDVPRDTGDLSRDDESARGIRRRLQKRANAGDSQAAELVSQLTAGT